MKNYIRRFAAGLAAIVMMGTAAPIASVPVMAADLISNSTFDSGSTGWGMYKESGGAATLGTEDGKLALHISATGKVTYSVQMYYDIIPLYQNAKYRLSYEISCTKERFVEGMIQQNGGDYTAYTWKGLDIGPEPQKVDYEFTMEDETDIMSKLVFNCGLQEKDGGDIGEHTIYLDNVVLEKVDDSAVDYSSIGPYQAPILTNQIGYKTNAPKVAVFRGITNQNEFSVVNADSKQTVFTGKLGETVNNASAGEDNWTGDFSSVTEPGKYYIHCDGLDDSYVFEIGADPFSALYDASITMLNYQRCGTEVSAGAHSHPACHTAMATIYGTNEQIDVSGGWHDAGDYGRYVVAGAKAVGDLLYAYQANPNPAILSETKYELDWMLKMQAQNGGVYHKVTCENFPGYVAPEKETAPLIVTPISTTATADFAASMALAAQVYKTSDAEFAQKCLTAAEKAWSFLEQNPDLIFQNPEDITTGEYGDTNDKDERYWAAAQLWITTGDQKYEQAMNTIGTKSGLDWSTVGDYGNIAILYNADKNSDAYAKAKAAVIKEADKFVQNANSNPYGSAITRYEWGSNMTIANAGIICALASQLTGDNSYALTAQKQLNYLLGENPLGTCFVTGYGTVSPEHPHHRPSMAAGSAMPGMLVGGVDQWLDDSAAKAYCAEAAPAKCYVDNSESYSTNEITIYWNSPLTYLLTIADAESAPVTEPTEPSSEQQETSPQQETQTPDGVLYGDVNLDGTVDIMDVIKLNKYLLGGGSLDNRAKVNADVDINKTIDSTDSLNILKYVVEIQKTLPIGDVPAQPAQTETTEQPSEPITDTTEPLQQETTAPQPTEPSQTETTESLPETHEVETQPTQQQETQPQQSSQVNGIPVYGTPMKADADAVADFTKGETPLFFASDGWTNGSCFDCYWYKGNTSLDNGMLSLSIDAPKSSSPLYSGAEYRTADFYGYGYYETSMQAIKNPGVVSSFFTYTGPSDNNPWDEIDIEILGKDTTKVQFNYYTNAQGNHEFMYDLGFDASEGFHTYGFDWQPDHIDWYVDGQKVYSANQNIPSTPGKIMMNTWPGVSDPNNKDNVIDWLQAYDGKTPLTAHYLWVTYDK